MGTLACLRSHAIRICEQVRSACAANPGTMQISPFPIHGDLGGGKKGGDRTGGRPEFAEPQPEAQLVCPDPGDCRGACRRRPRSPSGNTTGGDGGAGETSRCLGRKRLCVGFQFRSATREHTPLRLPKKWERSREELHTGRWQCQQRLSPVARLKMKLAPADSHVGCSAAILPPRCVMRSFRGPVLRVP
jgi:hypothetical protein